MLTGLFRDREAAERAVAIFREVLGPTHQRLASALWTRGDAAYAQRDWPGAERRYREAADQFEALDLPVDLAWMQHKLGLVLVRLGRVDEAIAAHERGLVLREEVFGANDLEIVKSVLPLAAAEQAAGELGAALAHAKRGEAIARRLDVWRLLALALHRRARIERTAADDDHRTRRAAHDGRRRRSEDGEAEPPTPLGADGDEVAALLLGQP